MVLGKYITYISKAIFFLLFRKVPLEFIKKNYHIEIDLGLTAEQLC